MKIKHKIEPEMIYSFKSRMNRENAYVLRLKELEFDASDRIWFLGYDE